MPRARNNAPDIKFAISGTERRFRLAVDPRTGRKLWQVREPSEVADTPSDASYLASDFSWGMGLNRFTPVEEQGHVLRIADGYGIDTTNGSIQHGPGGTNAGTISNGTMVEMFMFNNLVWILTTTSLYNYDGTTLTHFWGPAASGATHQTSTATTLNSVAIFNSKIYMADGTDIYRTDGTTDPNATSSTDNADFLISVDTSEGPQLWRAYDTNLVSRTTNPDTATPTWATPITVGPGESITKLYSLAGLVFVGTESTIFSITSSDVAVELDKRLQSRRSTSAFSISSNTGSDVWLSDGSQDIFRMLPIDFEQFDIRPAGPHVSDRFRPFTELGARGDVTSIAQDTEHVYVATARGSDIYVYKGAEKERGLFAWSPLIRIASATNNVMGVFKLTGDSEAFLYVNAGTTLWKYQVRDWTLFNTAWEVEFPDFDNGDELERKVWSRLRVSMENSTVAGDHSVQGAVQTDGGAYVNLPFTFANDGVNNVITSAKSGTRIRLKLTNTSINSASSLNVRAIQLEGTRKPELRYLYDMVVMADNEGDWDFIQQMRELTTSFFLFDDRRGTQRQGVLLPRSSESLDQDENMLRGSTQVRLLVQEVLAS